MNRKTILLISPTGKVGTFLNERLIHNGYDMKYITRDECSLQDGEPIDVCIYTASVTSHRNEPAQKYVEDNCHTAVKVVEICKKHNVKKIIYLSSDEIYGSLRTEELNSDSGRIDMNVYAMTKYLSEQIIIESGISYNILRLPGIVGGGKLGDSFLERAIVSMESNRDIYCYNLEKSFNNVVHIEDLCDFIIKLVEKDTESMILHLGQTECWKMWDILNYIKKELESAADIIAVENSEGRFFTLPTAEAEQLGYSSRGIEHIVDELIEYVKRKNDIVQTEYVEVNHEQVCRVGKKEIHYLKEKADKLDNRKYRLCLHNNTKDRVHTMLNAYLAYSYVRPHYHPHKTETKIIFEGELLVVLFDNNGKIKDHFIMSTKSEDSSILHLQPKIVHMNIPLTDTVFLEITSGPFDAETDNIFLDSFPIDMSSEDVRNYVSSIIGNVS